MDLKMFRCRLSLVSLSQIISSCVIPNVANGPIARCTIAYNKSHNTFKIGIFGVH